MKIGDRLKRRPTANDDKLGRHTNSSAPLAGTVVYIHPKRRFFVLRFDTGFREAFRVGGDDDEQSGQGILSENPKY